MARRRTGLTRRTRWPRRRYQGWEDYDPKKKEQTDDPDDGEGMILLTSMNLPENQPHLVEARRRAARLKDEAQEKEE